MTYTARTRRFMSAVLAFLAFFLFCFSPLQEHAAAIAVVDDAVLVIIIAALAAMGISFTMTGGFQTVSDWVSDQIVESGVDFSDVKYGANSLGNILLDNVFVRSIAAFAAYLRVTFGLTDNASLSLLNSGVTLGDIVAYPGTDWAFEYYDGSGRGVGWITNSTVYTIYYWTYTSSGNPRVKPLLYDDSPFQFKSHSLSSLDYNWDSVAWQNSKEYDQTDFYYALSNGLTPSEYPDTASIEVYNWTVDELLEYLSGKQPELRESLNLHTGTISIPSDNDLTDQGGVLSLPVPWGQSMGTTVSQLPGLVVSDQLAGNSSLQLDNESAVSGQVSDTATSSEPYVSSAVSDYQSPGLASVFPFCIPFDIYNFLSCLAADPVAPSISWRFYLPGLCDEQVEIDLAQFNTVAQIVRTMELLAFIVGLAFITRSRILRG